MSDGAKQDIVILEFGSHEDSFYSHFLFLQKRFRIHLIINEKLKALIPQSIPLASVQTVKVDGRTSLSVAWEVKSLLASLHQPLLFFHTAQGNIVRELTWLLPRRYRMMGVHHNADKLIRGHSFSQTIISRRIRHYFVLADYIKENLAGQTAPGIHLQEVYTLFYEKPADFRELPRVKKLRVTIPGAVEQSRRDFKGLLEALEKAPLSPEVEFVVLGNGSRGEGPGVQEEVKKRGLQSHFVFFQAYVSHADMVSYVASSDLILPLLHPHMAYYNLFSTYKISGTFNWAYAYQKPMLMFEDLALRETFRNVSIGYRLENLIEKINSLVHHPEELRRIARQVQQDPRFDFDRQQKLYDRFIDRVLTSKH